MSSRVRFVGFLAAGALLVGARPASVQGGLCQYVPQVRNGEFDPIRSFNEKLDQGCMILFDEWPEAAGSDQITISGLRTVADAGSQVKLVLYDPPVPIDRLGDEGYEFVFSESTHFYGGAQGGNRPALRVLCEASPTTGSNRYMRPPAGVGLRYT